MATARISKHLVPIIIVFILVTPSSSISDSDAAAIITRFQTYLRINTSHPTPNYTAAVSFLQTLAPSPPFQSRILHFAAGKPLLLITLPGSIPSLPSLLLNSHTDVVPSEPLKWSPHPPLSAILDPTTDRIFARGTQDMKSVSLQYLEAAVRLAADGFKPYRTVHFSFVPDEEIGGVDGAMAFARSEVFKELNVGLVLDEGLASEGEEYRVFYAERGPWWGRIKAVGAPGHGAKMYDGSAMENLVRSLERVMRFRRSQLDLVKSGEKEEGEVVSVNLVYLKGGTPSEPSPTVRSIFFFIVI